MTKSSKPIVVKFDLLEDNRRLLLHWQDGAVTEYTASQLRKDCPCAACEVERSKLAAAPAPSSKMTLRVIQGPAPTEARINELKPVGRYALAFRWNDGHQTGIYSFESLRASGRVVDASPT